MEKLIQKQIEKALLETLNTTLQITLSEPYKKEELIEILETFKSIKDELDISISDELSLKINLLEETLRNL
jgi:hypothetical protein